MILTLRRHQPSPCTCFHAPEQHSPKGCEGLAIWKGGTENGRTYKGIPLCSCIASPEAIAQHLQNLGYLESRWVPEERPEQLLEILIRDFGGLNGALEYVGRTYGNGTYSLDGIFTDEDGKDQMIAPAVFDVRYAQSNHELATKTCDCSVKTLMEKGCICGAPK